MTRTQSLAIGNRGLRLLALGVAALLLAGNCPLSASAASSGTSTSVPAFAATIKGSGPPARDDDTSISIGTSHEVTTPRAPSTQDSSGKRPSATPLLKGRATPDAPAIKIPKPHAQRLVFEGCVADGFEFTVQGSGLGIDTLACATTCPGLRVRGQVVERSTDHALCRLNGRFRPGRVCAVGVRERDQWLIQRQVRTCADTPAATRAMTSPPQPPAVASPPTTTPGGNPPATRGFAPPTTTLERQGAASPSADVRIHDIQPKPAVVGHSLILSGQGFGRRGRVQLEVGGLRLALTAVRWSDDEIEVLVPRQIGTTVGETDKPGRLWVYADQGGATSAITLGPDTTLMTPRIRRLSSEGLRPAQRLIIEGSNFLAEAHGSVQLSCPSLSRVLVGQILDWNDTAINTRFPAPPSAVRSNLTCELRIENHRGLSARRPVTLFVTLEQRDITLHVDVRREIRGHAPGRLGIFELSGGELRNGWVVRDSRIELTRDGHWRGVDWHWLSRPTPGTNNTAATVQLSTRTPGEPDSYPSEMRYILEIEGPEGLPYR